MDRRTQNNPDNGYVETNIHPRFTVNWSRPNEQQICQSVAKSMSQKMKPNLPLQQDAMHLYLQVKDKGSLLSQSPVHSHQEEADSGGTNSRLSSESGQTQSHSKPMDHRTKAFIGPVDLAFNPSHVDYSHIVTQNSNPYGAPQLGQFLYPYGTHIPMAGLAPARLLLPFDVAEEGPIYVNAKQYNGIMRRRQSRAKLEAQNKLVKVRKPYIHESRQQHALNRVRGSGGRFLSKTKLQQTAAPLSHFDSDSTDLHSGRMLDFEVHRPEKRTVAEDSLVSPPNQAMQKQPDIRSWSGMQGSDFSGGKKQFASIVR